MTEAQMQNLILRTCLLAGRIMTESGSEAYRVEDTMQRIATNAGEPENSSYVTATGLFMSLKSSNYSQLEQIKDRTINLEKVVAVNQLSREFAAGTIDLVTLHQELKKIDHETPTFPAWWRILAAGVISCTLLILFGGVWSDFIPAFLIGAIGYTVSLYGIYWLEIRFLNELVAALVIGSLSFIGFRLGIIADVDTVMIGSLMPLVPGVAITNSFRDILAGHLISGMARGTEAIFTAGAIGTGIYLVIKLLG
ncbi:threonine/serine exporter family protein [Enterococcus sp. LJL90]